MGGDLLIERPPLCEHPGELRARVDREEWPAPVQADTVHGGGESHVEEHDAVARQEFSSLRREDGAATECNHAVVLLEGISNRGTFQLPERRLSLFDEDVADGGPRPRLDVPVRVAKRDVMAIRQQLTDRRLTGTGRTYEHDQGRHRTVSAAR